MTTAFPLGPVVAMDVYRCDVVVRRQRQAVRETVATPRGCITELSLDSRKRLAFIVCNTSVLLRMMVTLTYPALFPSDGKTVKRHLNTFLMWCRRRWGKGLSYVWFLEFQKRGAPHIHLLLSPIRKRSDVDAVANAWYRIVASGDEKHLRAGTRTEQIRKPDGAARYACKYALKTYQKMVPSEYQNVGRFWGVSKDVTPQPVASMDIDEQSIRAILADWHYLPHESVPIYRVLYRTSDRVLEQIGQVLTETPV